MFSRRMFVALVACLAISTSSAFAGGNGGTKKDSTVKVNNNTGNPAFVFVGVSNAAIAAAFNNGAGGAAATQARLEGIGGQLVATGGTGTFKVKAGTQSLIVFDTNAALITDTTVSAVKGQTVTVNAV